MHVTHARFAFSNGDIVEFESDTVEVTLSSGEQFAVANPYQGRGSSHGRIAGRKYKPRTSDAIAVIKWVQSPKYKPALKIKRPSK